jgi:hypothetical protein
MDKTFYLGHHIWFVLHFGADGKMNGLQEHDWREGGHLSSPVSPDTWEEMFIRNLRQRCTGKNEAEAKSFKDIVEVAARTFMKTEDRTFRY